MKYILDTNVCISLLKGKGGVRNKVIEVGMENCYVSEITLAELYYGAAKSEQPKHYSDVSFIEKYFGILPIRPALELFGRNRYELERIGHRLDDFDLLIGSTAIVNNLVVVTHNTKHFDRIPRIIIEDWETAS